MDTHVKVLAWLYIVFGVLGSLLGLGLMALLGIIGVAGAASDPDAWMAVPILGFTGVALGVFMLVLSVPGIIAGAGLLKYRPWARILTIVLSTLNLINIPIGTILGVYGLWVMLSDEGSRLFVQPPRHYVESAFRRTVMARRNTMPSFTSRDVLRGGRDLATLLSLSTLAGVESPLVAPAEAAQDARRAAPDVYRAIGVKPVVNARGTFTIISGSLMLPEVRAAMDAAARQYVHLDELTESIGARLAVLTQAEWGLVTSGCSAAITHATAACIAGGNPDLHVRIPNLAGFAKDEVIIPRHSRNVYDAAVRSVGARVIEVTTVAELDAAIGPRTAMIYILAGNGADQSVLNTQSDRTGREPERCADTRGRGRGNSHGAERAPAERCHARDVQRREVPARTADRGPAARPQRSRARGLGAQRAASRTRARDEGRQGRGDRDAHRGRDVDEARPRRRMEAVDGMARSHLAPRHLRCTV